MKTTKNKNQSKTSAKKTAAPKAKVKSVSATRARPLSRSERVALSDLRAEKRLSQSDFAKAIKISPSALLRALDGQGLYRKTYDRISGYLNKAMK